MTEQQNKDPQIEALRKVYNKAQAENLQNQQNEQQQRPDEGFPPLPDVKPILPIYLIPEEFFGDTNTVCLADTKIAVSYFGWIKKINFTHYKGDHNKGKHTGIVGGNNKRIRYVVAMETFVNNIRRCCKQPDDFEKIVKLLVSRTEPRVAELKDNPEVEYYHLDDLNPQLDIFMKDRGVLLDIPADTSKKTHQEAVDDRSKKSVVVGMRGADNDLYPKRDREPQAKSMTSADKFERDADTLEFAERWEMQRDNGIEKPLREKFEEKYKKVLPLCIEMFKQRENIKLAKPEIKISQREIEASKAAQRDYGLSLSDNQRRKFSSILSTDTYRILILLLVMEREHQKYWIHNLQFSHLTITNEESFRFVIRVFMKLIEMNDGYCGINKFANVSAFREAADLLEGGRDYASGYEEMSYASLIKNDKVKADHIYESLREAGISRLQDSPELTDWEKGLLTNFVTNNSVSLALGDVLSANDPQAVRTALGSIRVIDPITGDDGIDQHSKPLPSDLKGMTDAAILHLCGGGVSGKVIRTPFAKLNYKLCAAGQTEGGIELGDLWVIAGASGSGKSFAIAEFAITALRNGLRVLFLTLENSEKTVRNRFCKRWNPWGVYDEDLLYDPEKKKGVVTTTNGNIYVAETPFDLPIEKVEGRRMATEIAAIHALSTAYLPDGATPGQLVVNPLHNRVANANTIRELALGYEIETGHSFDIILIDSLLQLSPNKEMVDANHNIMRKAVDEVHDFARDTGIPIVMTHQVNAQGNKAAKNNKRFTENEMGSTLGALQKAAVVLLNYVSKYHGETSCAEVILAKSRHGENDCIFHYMRDLPNGIGILPYSDHYIGSTSNDAQGVKIQRRKHRYE